MPGLTPEDDAETAELDRLVQEAVGKIIEHCDSVQVFVTKSLENGNGETYRLVTGRGNHCARYGLVREWVNQAEGAHHRYYEPRDPGEDDESEE